MNDIGQFLLHIAKITNYGLLTKSVNDLHGMQLLELCASTTKKTKKR